jgi:hypothetical protein
MKWFILLSLMGCAQVTSLNLKKHQFGVVPSKIIWFQIAGLEEEQIATLRFLKPSDTKTSFEDSICYGQTWNYNLYQLRNSSESTFLSQMTGKKNIKNSCEDTSLRPIWNYISNSGYETVTLENGANPRQSLLWFNSCPQTESSYLNPVHFFVRSKPSGNAQTFHYTEEISFSQKSVSYDRSCGDSICLSSILDNFKSIYSSLIKKSTRHLVIVRDFSYLEAIEKKDFKRAKEILTDIEMTYGEAMKLTNSNDHLVLLTTGDSRFIDIPDQGKAFFEFEKENKNVNVKRTKLTNLVLASGARAENFCGIYDDSDVFDRILSGPKQQGLELKIINPFK